MASARASTAIVEVRTVRGCATRHAPDKRLFLEVMRAFPASQTAFLRFAPGERVRVVEVAQPTLWVCRKQSGTERGLVHIDFLELPLPRAVIANELFAHVTSETERLYALECLTMHPASCLPAAEDAVALLAELDGLGRDEPGLDAELRARNNERRVALFQTLRAYSRRNDAMCTRIFLKARRLLQWALEFATHSASYPTELSETSLVFVANMLAAPVCAALSLFPTTLNDVPNHRALLDACLEIARNPARTVDERHHALRVLDNMASKFARAVYLEPLVWDTAIAYACARADEGENEEEGNIVLREAAMSLLMNMAYDDENLRPPADWTPAFRAAISDATATPQSTLKLVKCATLLLGYLVKTEVFRNHFEELIGVARQALELGHALHHTSLTQNAWFLAANLSWVDTARFALDRDLIAQATLAVMGESRRTASYGAVMLLNLSLSQKHRRMMRRCPSLMECLYGIGKELMEQNGDGASSPCQRRWPGRLVTTASSTSSSSSSASTSSSSVFDKEENQRFASEECKQSQELTRQMMRLARRLGLAAFQGRRFIRGSIAESNDSLESASSSSKDYFVDDYVEIVDIHITLLTLCEIPRFHLTKTKVVVGADDSRGDPDHTLLHPHPHSHPRPPSRPFRLLPADLVRLLLTFLFAYEA